MKIEGLTIMEMAEILELPYKTVQKRLERSGIQPITTGTIYPKEALETVRTAAPVGRPKKTKAAEPAEPPKKARKAPAKEDNP